LLWDGTQPNILHLHLRLHIMAWRPGLPKALGKGRGRPPVRAVPPAVGHAQ
jgi:hypothetical protein